jgi:hypothetical protein
VLEQEAQDLGVLQRAEGTFTCEHGLLAGLSHGNRILAEAASLRKLGEKRRVISSGRKQFRHFEQGADRQPTRAVQKQMLFEVANRMCDTEIELQEESGAPLLCSFRKLKCTKGERVRLGFAVRGAFRAYQSGQGRLCGLCRRLH